jgi:amidase
MEDEIAFLDATAQADLIRRGELSPREAVEAAIARCERLNPRLNAVIAPFYDEARAQVPSLPADAPFRGVPMLLKDLGGALAGAPLYGGMRVLRDAGWREPEDSFFTARLRAAGFCFLGRTSTPELGLLPTSEPEAFGPTRNPWNEGHSAGGSSGGSAAAVAAGMVSVAHASDGGGSIRIPASSCGLVGLKPTRARNSFGPGAGERWAGFSCEHVVARSVRDVAALLDVVSGPFPGDPYFAPPPAAPFAARLEPGPRLRIGTMIAMGPRETPLHADCRAAGEKAARALAELGHHVEPAYPAALDESRALEAYVHVVASNIAFALATCEAKIGRPVTEDDVEPLTWALADIGRSRSAVDYIGTLDVVHGFSRRVATWWSEGFDLLLTPTTADPPPPIGYFAASREEPFKGFLRAAPFGAFTSAFNLTGQPAISVPVHWNEVGLPVGAQLVAAYGREDVLLRAAAELEQAVPWRDRRPPTR